MAAAPDKSVASAWGIVTVLITLLCWTSIPPTLRWLAPSIDGWTANGWRYLTSALIWLPVLAIAWRRGTLPPGIWKAAAIPAVFNALAQIAFGLAPYYIKPGLMTFAMRLQIVFLMTGAAIMFAAERRIVRTPLFLAGAAMVLGGTLLTVALNPSGLGGGTALGVGLSVGSGLLYAAYALAVRKYLAGINALTAFSVISQYTAVPLFLAMLVMARDTSTGQHDMGMSLFAQSGQVIAVTLVSAVIGIGIGHTLYFYSITRLGLVVAAGVVQLQPVTVSIVSSFLFAEMLAPEQWATGIAAIVGAILMLVAQHQLGRRDALARAEAMPAPEP